MASEARSASPPMTILPCQRFRRRVPAKAAKTARIGNAESSSPSMLRRPRPASRRLRRAPHRPARRRILGADDDDGRDRGADHPECHGREPGSAEDLAEALAGDPAKLLSGGA